MKKVFFALMLMTAALSTYAHSGVGVRLLFDVQSDFDMEGFSFDSLVSKPFRDAILWGGTVEVILGHTGFGFTGLVNLPLSQESFAEHPVFTWDGGLFLNHHFFGAGSLLDPFLGIGFNCAGDVTVLRTGSYGSGTWGQPLPNSGSSRSVRLGMYPFLSGGFALNLDGLILGAKLAAQPWMIDIPRLTAYRNPAYSVDLFAGFSIGGK